MKPLSVVGAAAVTVQFADFGKRLLSETANVYKGVSGTESKVVELGTIVSDLMQLSESISTKLSKLDHPDGLQTPVEEDVLGECRCCEAVIKEVMRWRPVLPLCKQVSYVIGGEN